MDRLKILSSNQIKSLAIAAMFADHLAWWLLETLSPGGQLVHGIGRLTAPLMCLFVVEGYIHTKDVGRYLKRMLLFAAVSHFPYVWYFGYPWYKYTSVIFTLFVGLLLLYMNGRVLHNVYAKTAFALLCLLLVYNADWSYIAVLWIFALYLLRDRPWLRAGAFAAIGLLLYALPRFIDSDYKAFYVFGFLIALVPMALYNGERGIKNWFTKWSFYVFYPLHLLILAVCKYCLGRLSWL